jgi:hypothetical protein
MILDTGQMVMMDQGGSMDQKTSIKSRRDGRCPYCHDEDLSGQNFKACSGCGAKQHKRCWEDHGACAGCGLAKATEPVLAQAPKGRTMSKKGIPPTKLVMGVAILAAVVALCILVPPARFVIAILALFGGFSSFLEWLDR